MKTLSVLVGSVVMVLFGFHPQVAGQSKVVRLYDGPPAGAWRPVSVFMKSLIEKRHPELSISVEAGGGASNVIAVHEGKGEFGMVATPSHFDGWEGRPPFKQRMRNIRQVANLWIHPVAVLSTKASTIRSLGDLKGKRVGVMPRGWTSETVNRRLLRVYGLTYNDLSAEFLVQPDALAALRDGRLDAVMYPTNPPADAAITEMGAVRPMRIVGLHDDKIKALQQENRGIIRVVVPKGTYPGIDYDVVTVAIQTSILANKDASEDLVLKVTKSLVEGLPELGASFAQMKETTPKRMASDIGIPYHPGAMRYFKSLGLVR